MKTTIVCKLLLFGIVTTRLLAAGSASGAQTGNRRPTKVSSALLEKVAANSVAEAGGLQILVGRDGQVAFNGSWGRRSLKDSRAVDDETLFCIGSCSKPFASTVLLALNESRQIRLDQTINTWLPEFDHCRLEGGGKISRTPTLAELLSHRGGIYSQKQRISRAQSELLYRSFDQTLARNVAKMAGFPYLAEPGTRYAYSGAGYCVLGRAAEVATGREFDQLLQTIICRPLGMKFTSYFPARISPNISEGATRRQGRLSPDVTAPHRTEPLAMQLVGGSLYSTAKDVARFARMIASGGAVDGVRVLSEESVAMALRPAAKDSNYGLGWGIRSDEDGRTEFVTHNGSLAAYRALIKIHVPTRSYLVMLRSIVVEPPGKMAKVKTGGPSLNAVVQAYFDNFIH